MPTRSQMHIILLAVWLFAIVGPSVITYLSDGNQNLITLNLNEEEQQEQGKKNIGEKLNVIKKSTDFTLLSYLQSSLSSDFYISSKSEHISDIVLPPPEHNILFTQITS